MRHQIRLASGPALAAVERVLRLRARAAASEFEGERTATEREADRLIHLHRLEATFLRAFMPPGAAPAPVRDDVLCPDGWPWWRAHLAIFAADYAGFGGQFRPWTRGRKHSDVALFIFGTRLAVEHAVALYATLTAAAISPFSCHVDPEEMNAFMLGVVMTMGHELQTAKAGHIQIEARRDRRAMILRPWQAPTYAVHEAEYVASALRGEPGGFAYPSASPFAEPPSSPFAHPDPRAPGDGPVFAEEPIDRRLRMEARDWSSALSRGLRAGKGLGRLALGQRRAMTPTSPYGGASGPLYRAWRTA